MTVAPPESETRAPPLAWAAAASIALAALVRAGVSWTPFPHWDGDPFTQGDSLVAIGPTMLMALDLAGCLGAAAAIATSPRVSRLGVGLFAIGAVGALVHTARSAEHAGLGSAWIAALACGLGAWHLGQFTPIRRALTAASVGLVGLLLAKGALQYFVEHPQTIEHFRETRDAFFQARGWEPDSRSALVYERRLMQPAATGWFGLSNVYATFVAGATAWLGIAAIRSFATASTRTVAFVLCLGALGGAGALTMTGSKGAWAAAVLGLVVGAIATSSGRAVQRGLPWVLTAIPVATIAAVLARGVVGERVGELSVLFRAFYFEGAARIFVDNPLIGAGPAGFKDAYVLARPPLSPEEVTSSHAAIIDWIATLGLFGAAWAALLLLIGRSAGRANGTTTVAPESADRSTRPFVLGVAVVVVAFSGLIERDAITPESAAMRACGLVAWLVLAWAISRTAFHHGALLRAAGAAGAAALLAHAQLDLAAVSENSAPLFMLWLGCLAVPLGTGPSARRSTRGAAAAAPALAAALLAALALPATIRWERGLRSAASSAVVVWDADLELRSASSAAHARVALESAAADLGVSIEGARSVGSAFGTVLRAAQEDAASSLDRALAVRPQHYGTRTALTRVLLQQASSADAEARQGLEERAIRIAEGGPASARSSASAWMWAGTVHAGLAEQADASRAPEHRRAARRFWEGAAELDPRGPSAPARLMAVCEALGDLDAARGWAERALQADTNMRLDPLKRLTAAERALAERLLATP